jgi:glycosyltransferase involved in cell wall biosynthesis
MTNPDSRQEAALPVLSVIVAVADGAKHLQPCLQAALASDLPRPLWELVVVDDGSLDRTAEVAAGLADVLVRLPGPPNGPAYARNRGVECSLGEILVFVDADVCLHRDALRRIALTFVTRPDLGAVFGSYDADPTAPGLISQYRNLRHHFVHQREAGNAETFWAGLGAMRRAVFVRAGRFDEWHFPKPQIEDIELGWRVRALDVPILLDPTIQGTHLKGWTLKGVVKADLENRGIPWIRLQLALGKTHRPARLVFSASEWFYTALACAALVLLLVAIRVGVPAIASLAGLLIVMVLVGNLDLYRFLARHRGPLFALRVIPVHILYYLANGAAAVWAWLLFHVIGPPAPPPEIQAYAERGLKTWPPLPAKAEGTSWAGGRRPPRP